MAITTLSSREFNQDTSRAKKATAKGPDPVDLLILRHHDDREALRALAK